MKILMLLSNPFIVDPRVYNEAKSLIDSGHKVTVIVWDRKNQYEFESIIDGIRIIRIHNSLLMKFLFHDLFRNPIWWRKAYRVGLKLYNVFKFDVVHCHDLDTLQSGVWLKKKIGCKLVYDAHEIFGYMIENDIPRTFVNIVFRLEKKLIRYVDQIITVNKPFKEYFEKITKKPIEIIMNCKDLISKRYIPTKNNIFTVSYIGVLNKSRLFPEIINTLGEIPNIKFIIAGKKEDMNVYKLVEKTSMNYENVDFLGPIKFNQVVPKTCESDVVLLPLNPSGTLPKIAIANKQFEAMVCGRPIICIKGTYSGNMTEELNCGLVVEYSVNAIKDAIIKLRDDPVLCRRLGENGLKAAISRYHWENEKKKLLELYENVLVNI
jgi:glycosyltransferase involved in cell wall biosynthesis